jgi:hypothetical protein
MYCKASAARCFMLVLDWIGLLAWRVCVCKRLSVFALVRRHVARRWVSYPMSFCIFCRSLSLQQFRWLAGLAQLHGVCACASCYVSHVHSHVGKAWLHVTIRTVSLRVCICTRISSHAACVLSRRQSMVMFVRVVFLYFSIIAAVVFAVCC